MTFYNIAAVAYHIIDNLELKKLQGTRDIETNVPTCIHSLGDKIVKSHRNLS